MQLACDSPYSGSCYRSNDEAKENGTKMDVSRPQKQKAIALEFDFGGSDGNAKSGEKLNLQVTSMRKVAKRDKPTLSLFVQDRFKSFRRERRITAKREMQREAAMNARRTDKTAMKASSNPLWVLV